MKPILSVVCDEPEGEVIRNIYELDFTPENLDKMLKAISKFPTLYGKEIKSIEDVMKMFFDNDLKPRGIFYVVDDFVGLFYLTDFAYDYTDVLAHYTFFDRRHKGRINLVKAILKYAFELYNFQRISVEIPLYVADERVQRSKQGTMNFIRLCGFVKEGRKRKATRYNGELFDINLYGILRSEVVRHNGST